MPQWYSCYIAATMRGHHNTAKALKKHVEPITLQVLKRKGTELDLQFTLRKHSWPVEWTVTSSSRPVQIGTWLLRGPCLGASGLGERYFVYDTQVHPTIYLLLKSEELSHDPTRWRRTDTQLELNCFLPLLTVWWRVFLAGNYTRRKWGKVGSLQLKSAWKVQNTNYPPWIKKKHETAAALDDYLSLINNIRTPSFQFENTYSSSMNFLSFF